MDRIHLYVLIALVEFHGARHTGKVFRRSEDIADRLWILAASFHHVRDKRDLVVRVCVKVGWIGVEFRLEGLDEVTDQRSLIGRVELDDANIPDRSIAGLLLKPKGNQIVPSWIALPPPPFTTPACISAWVIFRPCPSSV